MKRTSSLRHVFRSRRLCVALAACFGAIPAFAAPTGAQIVAGTAAVSQVGTALTVTNSNGAIIHWDSFSIAANESVKFAQASNSSVLNRVIGNVRSDILGQLSSDGRVFLINPAGIMIGAGAQINVGSFVASTLQMSDADFLAGRYRFFTDPLLGAEKLSNAGTITSAKGGKIYLVAPQIENTKDIIAPGGEAILAAGKTVEIGDTASPGVRVEITGAGSESVTNLGRIVADAGRIGLVGALVKNSGIVSATSAVEQGGKIFLRATSSIEQTATGSLKADGTRGGEVRLEADNTTLVDGSISATGSSGSGGSVQLLGDKVGLINHAAVDASGTSGGGIILVGGDYQGANADIKNASVTYFGADATLKADAIDSGNGGKVIVWADDTTRAYGRIFARGGASGGDGGLVETSGHRYLDFRGKVNTSAAKGKSGSLLLDPTDVTITTSSTEDLNGNVFENSGGDIFYKDGGVSTIDWDTIVSNLGDSSGTHLTISTQGYEGSGDITFAAGTYEYGSLSGLAFWANRNIALSGATLKNTSTGAIEMIAGWNGLTDGAAAPIANIGTISLTNGAQISTGGILDVRAGADIILNGSSAGGAVTLTSSGSSQWIEAGNRVKVLGGTGGDATISYTGSGVQTVKGGDGIEVKGDNSALGHSASINSSGQQTLETAGTLTVAGGASTNGDWDVSNNYALISAEGQQQISASAILLAGGGHADSNSSGNYAKIVANGPQSIYAKSISIAGGIGSVLSSDNDASISQLTCGVSQMIRFTESGQAQTLTLTGGSGQSSFARIYSAGAQTITGTNSDSFAAIILNGGGTTSAGNFWGNTASIIAQGAQQIDAKSIVLSGGGRANSIGSNNMAEIVAYGHQQIVADSIGLTGGGRAESSGSYNTARIFAYDTQQITSSSIALTGGGHADSSGTYNTALITANDTQQINTGELTLFGGNGNSSATYNYARIAQLGAGKTQTIEIDNREIDPIVKLQGGQSGQQSYAQITSYGDQTFRVVSGSNPLGITLQGGGTADENSSGNYAEIIANGTQSISAYSISVKGGAGNSSTLGNDARIVQVDSIKTQTLSAETNIEILGGTGNNNRAEITSAGSQTLEAGDMLSVSGGGDKTSSGSANEALISAHGYQIIRAKEIEVKGGKGDNDAHDNSARIQQTSTAGSQMLFFDGSGAQTPQLLTLTGGEGGYQSEARIESYGIQSIIHSGSDPLNITLTGGTSEATGAAWSDHPTACTDCATFNEAAIRSRGTQTLSATNLTITGGESGVGNSASVKADGIQTITVSDTISLSGGGSGGLFIPGYGVDGLLDNGAHLNAETEQIISASTIQLFGGGGADSVSGAYLTAPKQTLTADNISLIGGNSQDTQAEPSYASGIASAALIGWDEASDITLTVTDAFRMTGGDGSAGTTVLGSLLGTSKIDLNAASIEINGNATAKVFVGNRSGLASTNTLHLHATGTGGIALGENSHLLAGSNGQLSLTADAGAIAQSRTNSQLIAKTLTVTADSGISLVGSENRLSGPVSLMATTGDIDFIGDAATTTITQAHTGDGDITLATTTSGHKNLSLRNVTASSSTGNNGKGLIDISAGGDIALGQDGNLVLDENYRFDALTGSLILTASGNLDINGPVILHTPQGVSLSAGNNLTINDLAPTHGLLAFAGNTLNFNTHYDNHGDGDTWLSAGTINIFRDKGVWTDTLAVTAGQLNVEGTLSATHSAGVTARQLTLNGGTIVAETGDLTLDILGNLQMTGGSIAAGNTAAFSFYSTDSMLTLAQHATFGAARIDAGTHTASGLITVDYLARTDGGCSIDGASTFSTTSGGSGFYNNSLAALLGTDLLVTYSGTTSTTTSTTPSASTASGELTNTLLASTTNGPGSGPLIPPSSPQLPPGPGPSSGSDNSEEFGGGSATNSNGAGSNGSSRNSQKRGMCR